ncbi:F-actin-capping protein [Kappamyces sp. JEL0829]|nr:F-actin-capping protein [Kappamyces sp. JEL0829]
MSDFLLQSPPGQINDVYNDLIALTTVDKSLFQAYNLLQNIPISLANGEKLVLGPDATFVEGEGMLAWKGSLYQIDHIKLEGVALEGQSSDWVSDTTRQELTVWTWVWEEACMALRDHGTLVSKVSEYTENYYPTGASSVYKTADGYAIYIVGNSYNPSNFWYARARLMVHYYEDGNVQLNSTKEFAANDLPKDAHDLAATVIKIIQKSDAMFQTAINNSFADSGVSTFKNLRRALPVTRTKIEWASIVNYKVGDELSKK